MDSVRQMRAQLTVQLAEAEESSAKRNTAVLDTAVAGVGDEFRRQVADLEARIADMSTTLGQTNATAILALRDDLAGTRADVRAQVADLQSRVPEPYWLVDALRPLVTELVDANVDLGEGYKGAIAAMGSTSLEETRAELTRLRDELVTSGSELHTELLHAAATSGDRYASAVKAEVERLRQDLRRQLDQLDARVTATTANLERRTAESQQSSVALLRGLASTTSEVRAELDDVRASLPDQISQLRQLRAILSEASETAELQTKVAVQSALMPVREELHDSRADVRSHMGELKALLSETRSLLDNGRLAALQSAVLSMRDEVGGAHSAFRSQFAEIHAQLSATTAILESGKVAAISSVLSSLQDDLSGTRNDVRAKLAELQARMPEAYVLLEGLRQMRTQLSMQLEESSLTGEQELAKALPALRAELSGTRSDIWSRLNELEARVPSELEESSQTLLTSVLSALREEAATVRGELIGIVDELQSGLQQTVEKYEAAESRLRSDVTEGTSLLAATVRTQLDDAARTIVDSAVQVTGLRRSYEELTELYAAVTASHREVAGHPKDVRVETSSPIAADSLDHIAPRGTGNDNSSNLAFNAKLARWIPAPKISVLDLGCAGGGFVRSVLDMGCFAIGIEGSDYSKLRGRAEWATIPDSLFTADVAEPFDVVATDGSGTKSPVQFTVVTAWELFEHIPRERVAGVCANILRHLGPGGLVIVSIATTPDQEFGVSWHRTIESREWWIAELASHGLVHREPLVAYLDGAWVRGGEPTAPDSFHLVLNRGGDDIPFVERLPGWIRESIEPGAS